MIDLSIISQKTFDLKMQDGTLLNIRKPNNQLFNDVFKIIKLIEANGEEKNIINAIYIILARILNRNMNEIKFQQNVIEEIIDLDTAMYIVQEYWKFVQEVMQDINF
jgi:hypothetical protein